MSVAVEDDDRSRVAGKPSGSPADRRIVLRGHRIESRDLFVETREITIAHGGEVYRLRLTAQNKLILTK
jgi:hemin uptake protein HemP